MKAPNQLPKDNSPPLSAQRVLANFCQELQSAICITYKRYIMKKTLLCFIINTAFLFLHLDNAVAQVKGGSHLSQKQPARIEITQYFNIDKYPEFRVPVNPTYDHIISIKGVSWGMDVGYRMNVFRNIYIKPFVGFYRFSFNKIDNYNELFNTHAKARHITSPPGPVFWTYSTDRYFYKCVNIGLSAENEFVKEKYLSFSGGLLINNYLTFSQKYFLTENPNQIENPRKRSRTDFWGFRLDVFAKFSIPVNKFLVGPVVSLPVYTMWKTDSEFPYESNSDTRTKWIKGGGMGISISHTIN